MADETGDASRRTLLAWLRTGLTVIAVALGVGKIAPDIADAEHVWPFATLGVGYAVLGVAVVAYGMWRGRVVDRELRAGRWVSLNDGVMWAIGGITIALGVATAVLIFVDA